MVDEESHPTDLSVSSEEGHSTITFTFIENKVTWQRWLRRKITQKWLEILLLLYNLHIFSSRPKHVFVLSSNFLENLEHLVKSPRFGVCLCICCGGSSRGVGGGGRERKSGRECGQAELFSSFSVACAADWSQRERNRECLQ